MACGKGRRFGENKLLQAIDGKSLAEIAIDSLPMERFERVVFVTKYEELFLLAKSKGLISILLPNDETNDVSLTITSGMEYIGESDGCMFCVCDQPLKTTASINKLIDKFFDNPGSIVALSYNGKKGNPVIFDKVFFDELKHLKGDNSGSFVIKANKDKLLLCEANHEYELFDVDTKQDLAKLKDMFYLLKKN